MWDIMHFYRSARSKYIWRANFAFSMTAAVVGHQNTLSPRPTPRSFHLCMRVDLAHCGPSFGASMCMPIIIYRRCRRPSMSAVAKGNSRERKRRGWMVTMRVEKIVYEKSSSFSLSCSSILYSPRLAMTWSLNRENSREQNVLAPLWQLVRLIIWLYLGTICFHVPLLHCLPDIGKEHILLGGKELRIQFLITFQSPLSTDDVERKMAESSA